MTTRRMQTGALPMQLIGAIVLMIMGVIAGVMILQSMSETDVDDPAARAVRNADYPICGDYSHLEEIRRKDLKTIIYARHLQKCDSTHTNVTLTFTLSNRSLGDMMKRLQMVSSDNEPLILYRQNCASLGGSTDAGFNGVIVGGDQRPILFHEGSEIQISQDGSAVKLCEL